MIKFESGKISAPVYLKDMDTLRQSLEITFGHLGQIESRHEDERSAYWYYLPDGARAQILGYSRKLRVIDKPGYL